MPLPINPPEPSINVPDIESQRDVAFLPLAASALTFHIAYFNPLNTSEARADRIEKLNELIEDVYNPNGQQKPQIDLLSKTHTEVTFRREWGSIPVTFQFILHMETLSLVIYIHAGLLKTTAVPDPLAAKLAKNMACIDELITGVEPQNRTRGQIRTFLYGAVWRKFFRDHKKIPPPYSHWNPSYKYPNLLLKTKVISRFVGVIIRDKTKRTCADFMCPNDFGFLLHLREFLYSNTSDDKESCTINTMDDGKAFYLATLPKMHSARNNYILYTDCLDQDRLGALIATGHHLGVLRYSALSPINLDDSHVDSVHLIFQIEEDIETILNKFRKKFSSDGSKETQLDEYPSIDDLKESIAERFEKLDEPYRDIGGIRYRLHQCIRYKQTFDRGINALKIGKVHGFESYADTTHDMLEPTFRRIEQVLSDYDDVSEKYYKLRHILSSEETSKLQVTAEVFLFFALVPYYLGHALTESLHVIFDLGEGGAGNKHIIVDKIIWGCAAVFGLVKAIESLAKHKESGNRVGEIADVIYIKVWRVLSKPTKGEILSLIVFITFLCGSYIFSDPLLKELDFLWAGLHF